MNAARGSNRQRCLSSVWKKRSIVPFDWGLSDWTGRVLDHVLGDDSLSSAYSPERIESARWKTRP